MESLLEYESNYSQLKNNVEELIRINQKLNAQLGEKKKREKLGSKYTQNHQILKNYEEEKSFEETPITRETIRLPMNDKSDENTGSQTAKSLKIFQAQDQSGQPFFVQAVDGDFFNSRKELGQF
mmetsp:Transcript_21879/g.19422  ORF Transcript_21879/g.19422 Transcript_21879/m.19422 type:complete len:124 (+) Transcript_21879:675-1046(+)